MFILDPNFSHPGNMIRDVHPGFGSWFFYLSRIPDQGVKKAPDSGSGSATLVFIRKFNFIITNQDTSSTVWYRTLLLCLTVDPNILMNTVQYLGYRYYLMITNLQQTRLPNSNILCLVGILFFPEMRAENNEFFKLYKNFQHFNFKTAIRNRVPYKS
jgi:hypothetical protein